MPVTCIPSEEENEKQKSTAKKRRRNQNLEIDDLSLLLPVARGYGTMMDKISTLRMTSAYLKLNTFLASIMGSGNKKSHSDGGSNLFEGYAQLLQQAADGFFLILDNKANILYVSETISDHVDLAQQDVLGLSLYEITHEDDAKVIDDNLQPIGVLKTTQFRQFYIRCKSTLTPGRMQQSRFTGYKMVQIVGHLKLSRQDGGKMAVLGLIAECHLIETTPSILELSIPQTYFISTVGLDLKIISVDTRVTKVTGFDPINFIGADLEDYFHPLDHVKMTPCRALLLRSGAAVSPVFRFMTSTGDWIWAQLEGLVRYKEGTTQPLYYEVKCKAVSHSDGNLKFVEQTQLYAASDAKAYDNPKSIHRDNYFVDRMPSKPVPDDPKPIVCGLADAAMPPGVMDALLHSRELGLEDLEQRGFKRLATEESGSHGHSSPVSSHGSPQANGGTALERAKSSCSVTSDYYSYPSPHSTASFGSQSTESPHSATSTVLRSVGSPDSMLASYQSPDSVPFMSPDANRPDTHTELPEGYNDQSWHKPLHMPENPFHPQENQFHLQENPFHLEKNQFHPQQHHHPTGSQKNLFSSQQKPFASPSPPLYGCVPPLAGYTATPRHQPTVPQINSGYALLMNGGGTSTDNLNPGSVFMCTPLLAGHQLGQEKHTRLQFPGSVTQSCVLNGDDQNELGDILEQFI